jgi:hypothetical protein
LELKQTERETRETVDIYNKPVSDLEGKLEQEMKAKDALQSRMTQMQASLKNEVEDEKMKLSTETIRKCRRNSTHGRPRHTKRQQRKWQQPLHPPRQQCKWQHPLHCRGRSIVQGKRRSGSTTTSRSIVQGSGWRRIKGDCWVGEEWKSGIRSVDSFIQLIYSTHLFNVGNFKFPGSLTLGK